MKTFYVLWEITFPAVIIGVISYIVYAMAMYQYLQVGHFRYGFKRGGPFKKLLHIFMFIIYLPVYILLLIIDVY